MGSKTVMVGRGRRLELAGELGADYLINFETEENIVQAIRDITGGIGVDQAFDAAGTKDSLAQCIFSARKDGQVACVALPTVDMHELPVKTMVMNQIHVHGSRANPNCCAEVLQYMSEGKINAAGLITHVIPLSDFHHAMEVFTKRLEGAMKVVVIP
jgi:L-iditol 2-dehydrogenase